MTRGLKIYKFLIVCLCSMALISCKSRDDETNGTETKALISLVKGDLDKTKRELTGLKQDLQDVMEVQNELTERVKQLISADRENVAVTTDVAGPDIKNFVAQLNEQRQNLSRLESRVTQLNAAIENLRTSITEQQSAINELLNIVEEQAVIEEQQEDINY
jgi:septal ring factor EnvC (AmiA/AmiB activator)